MHADMDEVNKINAELNAITDLNTDYEYKADLEADSDKNIEAETLADLAVATKLTSYKDSDIAVDEQTVINSNTENEIDLVADSNISKSGEAEKYNDAGDLKQVRSNSDSVVDLDKNLNSEVDKDSNTEIAATSTDAHLDPVTEIKTDAVDIDLKTDADKTAQANLDVIENNKSITINTIYFDFDKSNIRYDAQLELDKIAEILTEHPQMEIEINSHTDSRGKNSYNLELSNNRAESTIQYLVNKGIESKRVTGLGYGELQLAENCPNGIPCTGLQHQLNRRSEFLVFQNGLNDVTFRSSNISNTVNPDRNKYTLNSGEFVNYNFASKTQVYTVQVGAFHGNVQTNKYSKLTNLFNHRYNDGFNRYYAGIFETSTQARNHMKLLKKKGFDGVFVVGLNGSERK